MRRIFWGFRFGFGINSKSKSQIGVRSVFLDDMMGCDVLFHDANRCICVSTCIRYADDAWYVVRQIVWYQWMCDTIAYHITHLGCYAHHLDGVWCMHVINLDQHTSCNCYANTHISTHMLCVVLIKHTQITYNSLITHQIGILGLLIQFHLG